MIVFDIYKNDKEWVATFKLYTEAIRYAADNVEGWTVKDREVPGSQADIMTHDFN